MAGVVQQTINQTSPAPLALPINPNAQSTVTALNQGNVSGVNNTGQYEVQPYSTVATPTTTNTANNTATNSNNANGILPSTAPLTVSDVSASDTTPSTEGPTQTNPYTTLSGASANSGSSYKTTLNNSTSSNGGGHTLDTLNNVYKLGKDFYNLTSGTVGGLVPLSTSAVGDAGLASANAFTDTGALLQGIDTSAIGGSAADIYGSSALINGGADAAATANAATDTSALMSSVDTSALGSSSAGASGSSGLLGSASSYAAPAAAGFLSGSLEGGAIGSPGWSALAGGATGAGEGALIGTFLLPGIGTAAGAIIGGLAGILGGVLGGQHPTVGPDGNTSIQGWNDTTNTPKFISGQDNGGTSSASNQLANQGWDAVTTILKHLGGTATGAAGVNVGTFKGKYTVNNPGSGYTDSSNPTESVGKNESANYFSSPTQAEAEFIAQQLNYIGSSGKATGLSQDQLSQLSKVSYQDVLKGNIPGMSQQQANTTTTNGATAGANGTTDWGVVGSQKDAANVPGFDRGGFVEGEGGPRDDKVDAKLSHEEFVFPADVVDRIGGGDGTNTNPEASQRGARSLVALIDHIRGADADKYGRPKNVDGIETPHFGLGGGMFMSAGPSSATAHQNELSQGGSVGQIIRNDNISTPTAYDSKAMCYAGGGLVDKPDPNDYTSQYNTPLSPNEEQQFQSWAKTNNKTKDLYDYDMRGWWKNDGHQSDDSHFSDEYKKPNHPTFSDQSKYNGSDGNQGGSWSTDKSGNTTFTPSQTNLQHYSPQELKQYFNTVEPDSTLIIPQYLYSNGGLIPRPGNNSNNFAGGGMTPWPNNNFHDGGLVHDNIENDVEQPASSVGKKTPFKQRKFNSGYDAHGISQELGQENNAAHMYANGGFVVDKYKPSRRGSYAKDNYNKGGLIKKPVKIAPNATFYN